jgi:hypothetical protein
MTQSEFARRLARLEGRPGGPEQDVAWGVINSTRIALDFDLEDEELIALLELQPPNFFADGMIKSLRIDMADRALVILDDGVYNLTPERIAYDHRKG